MLLSVIVCIVMLLYNIAVDIMFMSILMLLLYDVVAVAAAAW